LKINVFENILCLFWKTDDTHPNIRFLQKNKATNQKNCLNLRQGRFGKKKYFKNIEA
jgi:hypothetical protein